MEASDFYKQTTQPDLHAGEERLAHIPHKIGPYKVEGLLNKGGMSYLYLGLSEAGEPIAIKVLVPKYIQHKEMVARFLKEAQVISMTNHPNIVKLYGEGEWEKGLYIAMELIRGISLRQFIQSKSLSQKKALEIVLQVAYALCHLHVHGVIHRDLKPENILITESGDIKVIDFGIAQLKEDLGKESASSHRLMGTPAYMSPEQKENSEKVTYASDIYSLGVITYELLLGKLSHGAVHLSLFPQSLRQILEKALKEHPKDRYSDIVDFITDISQYLKTMREEPAEELLHLVESGHTLLTSTKPPQWPAAEIGFAIHQGDSDVYVDFFRLSDTHLAIAIAEPFQNASVFHMLGFRGMLRTVVHLSKELSSVQMLSALNQALYKDPMHQKIALAFLLLDAEKNSLSFISCGSNQLFHLPEESSALRSLTSKNEPLGAHENFLPLETRDNWGAGDLLFLCSREVPPLKNEREIHLLTPEHQAKALLTHITTKQAAAAISIHRSP